MNAKNNVAYACALFLLSMHCGCVVNQNDDNDTLRVAVAATDSPALDCPFGPSGAQATLMVRSRNPAISKIIGKGESMWYEWKSDDILLATISVAAECDQFRNNYNLLPPRTRTTFESNSRYRGNLIDVEVNALSQVDVIVAVLPTICVRVEGLIPYANLDYEKRYAPVSRVAETDSGRRLHLSLPWGMAYGTRLPYTDQLMWYSPSLDVKLRPVETDAEGNPEIKVPWGVLHFTRDGEDWKVTATVTSAGMPWPADSANPRWYIEPSLPEGPAIVPNE